MQVAFALKGAGQDENLLELLQSHKDQIETEIKGVTQLGTGQRSMTDKSSGFAGAIVKPARELMAHDGWTILKKPFGAIEESLWKNTNALMDIGGDHPSLKDALKDDGQLMKELRSSLKVSRNNEEEKKAIVEQTSSEDFYEDFEVSLARNKITGVNFGPFPSDHKPALYCKKMF